MSAMNMNATEIRSGRIGSNLDPAVRLREPYPTSTLHPTATAAIKAQAAVGIRFQ